MQRSFLDDLEPPQPAPEPHSLDALEPEVRERLESYYDLWDTELMPVKVFAREMTIKGDRDPMGLLDELVKLKLAARSGDLVKMTWKPMKGKR